MEKNVRSLHADITLSRRAFVAIPGTIALAGLVGCAGRSQKPTSGKNVQITLPNGAGTGYNWMCETDNSILELITQETVDKSDKDVDGGSLEDTFHFSTVKKGNVTVKFTLARAWQEDAVRKTCSYSFTVDENKNATLTGYEGPDDCKDRATIS